MRALIAIGPFPHSCQICRSVLQIIAFISQRASDKVFSSMNTPANQRVFCDQESGAPQRKRRHNWILKQNPQEN
jgi:hypothetical protein